MTEVPVADDELTRLEGESWAIGNAVVEAGPDHDGTESVAVWQLRPLGTVSGAWILPRAEVFGSAEAAGRLLNLLGRRAITTADPDRLNAVLEQLTTTAGVDAPRWWSDRTFRATDGLGELVERRRAYEETVERVRARRASVAELGWSRDFTSADCADFNSLRETAGVHVADASPVASKALTVCRVLQWLAGVWAETEQVKNRRGYVREAHGAPEPLPPSWLTIVRSAAGARSHR